MDSLLVVKEAFAAMEDGDFEKMEKNLDDEYQLVGPAPKPLEKTEFLDFCRGLVAGFPDWKFNITDLRESGDSVTGLLHISGKHTGDLDLSSIGLSIYPATGIRLAPVEEPMIATLRDGKIYRLEVASVEGGGIEGLLRQIGVSVPAHA